MTASDHGDQPTGFRAAPIRLPLLMLFIHDGVIVDSYEVFTTALIDACRMAGIQGVTSPENVVALFEGNVYESLRAKGAADAAIRDAVGRAAGALHRALPWLRPFPLMPQVLNELASARRVVVVTSNAERVVQAFLDKHGVDDVEVAGASRGAARWRRSSGSWRITRARSSPGS